MDPTSSKPGKLCIPPSRQTEYFQHCELSSYGLGMNSRVAQNHILDTIIGKSGKGAPKGLSVGDGDGGENHDYVDLGIRQKMEYVMGEMDKAAAAEENTARTPEPDLRSMAPCAGGQLGSGTWEPPSPAKSSHSDQVALPGRDGVSNAVTEWLDRPCGDGNNEAPVQNAAPGQESSSDPEWKRSLSDILIHSGLDARSLVLLWFRGVFDPFPTGLGVCPSLLTFDQLDREILASKLDLNETCSLLKDLEARRHSGMALDPCPELGQCRLCKAYKIHVEDPSRELEVINEFPQWKTKSRCIHKVCTDCTMKHILGAFDNAIWSTTGGIKFHCPVQGCSKHLGHIPKGGGFGSFSVSLSLKDRLFVESW